MNKNSKIAITVAAIVLITIVLVVCVKQGLPQIVSGDEENQIQINSMDNVVYCEPEPKATFMRIDIKEAADPKPIVATFDVPEEMKLTDNYFLCEDKDIIHDEVFLVSAGNNAKFYIAVTKDKHVLKNYQYETDLNSQVSKVEGVMMTIFSDDKTGFATFEIGEYKFFVNAENATSAQMVTLLKAVAKGSYK